MSQLAEENVIGALMIDANCIEKVCNNLTPEMFKDNILGAIYAEYLKGYNEGREVNIVTLDERVDLSIPRETLNETLFACMNETPTSASIRSYAQVVIDDYKTAQIETILDRTRVTGSTVEEDLDKLIGELEGVRDTRKTESKTLAEITKENKGNYFNEKNADKLYIGFPQLDEILGGLYGGDMVVIGARPSVGKSAFVTQVSTYLADHGRKVGFFSLEMQNNQMYERFLAAESGIGIKRIRRAVNFLGDEKERFDRANEKLEQQENIVITRGEKSIQEIRAESKCAGYDLIIIDYLQLLKPDTQYRGNRYAEVGAISHAIKHLAMELDIPVIALSQMNRVSEQRENKEPTMAELRESGDVEQDASVIILLWNEDENDLSRKGCKVEKNRQGEKKTMEMYFDGDQMHFEEVDPDNPFM